MLLFISRTAELLIKNLRGELKEEEQEEFDQVINESEENKRLLERLSDENYVRTQYQMMAEFEHSPGWQKIIDAGLIKPRKRAWLRYAAAAAVLLLITIGVFYYFNNSKPAEPATANETQKKSSSRETG